MKIERINDNQIQCILTSVDLVARNLSISELTYGSFQAKQLVSEMLKKAAADYGFQVDEEENSIMVETIPMPDESVVLLITKTDDWAEMDPKFSQFTPPPISTELYAYPDTTLEGAYEQEKNKSVDTSGMENIQPIANTEQDLKILEKKEEKEELAITTAKVFTFSRLDDLLKGVRVVRIAEELNNSLYKQESTGIYYLLIEPDNVEMRVFSSICNILSEYGVKYETLYATKAHIEEHFKIIIGGNALQSLAKIK